MANRRTQSSKTRKVEEDSDFDQDFDPSQESLPSEGEQQRKYAFDCVSESTSVIIRLHECLKEFLLITFLSSISGLLRRLKVSS